MSKNSCRFSFSLSVSFCILYIYLPLLYIYARFSLCSSSHPCLLLSFSLSCFFYSLRLSVSFFLSARARPREIPSSISFLSNWRPTALLSDPLLPQPQAPRPRAHCRRRCRLPSPGPIILDDDVPTLYVTLSRARARARARASEHTAPFHADLILVYSSAPHSSGALG